MKVLLTDLTMPTYIGPGPGHPDGALRCGHPVHVPLGPDAHAGAHGQTGLGALLYGPLHLLDMLEILTQENMNLSWIKDDYYLCSPRRAESPDPPPRTP